MKPTKRMVVVHRPPMAHANEMHYGIHESRPVCICLSRYVRGTCRFGEAWAALWAENLLTYLDALWHSIAQHLRPHGELLC